MLNLMVLHCAEVYGEIFCMLSHRCFFFGTFLSTRTIGNCMAFIILQTGKACLLLLYNFPALTWCHCFESWTLINVVTCLANVAVLLGFVTVMGRVLVTDGNKRVDRRTVKIASLAYGCSRSKPRSHFFVHSFEQITHRRLQLLHINVTGPNS